MPLNTWYQPLRQRKLALAATSVILATTTTQSSPLPLSENNVAQLTVKSPLQQRIDQLPPYATISLQAGIYTGNLIIDKPLTVQGNGDAIIDGQGLGRVITVDAANVTLSGLVVRDSGDSLAEEDAGIFVTAKGNGAEISNNQLTNNLIGIYLKGPQSAVVAHNHIHGRTDLRMNERGNGIHLWNTPGSRVISNRISGGRDGIFVTTSRDNQFLDNHITGLRFAVHYMYTNHSEVNGNFSADNHIGYAIMYSHHLHVHNNQSRGDRDRGVMLNYTNYSSISNNRVSGFKPDQPGPEKCFFIYNANFNQIRHNDFASCQIGIHFTAGSEGNHISNNNFVENRTQVKYVGTRLVEWSSEGQGNYWSDNTGFDLNGDGMADRPYRPNDLVDQLIWRYPLSKLLLNSPAIELLRWSQSQFPAFYPGGVIDSFPSMIRLNNQGEVLQ